MRIPAAGGTPQTLATPDPKKNELFYFDPQLLPGGKQILFSIELPGAGQTAALDLRTGEKKILVENVIASGRYVPTGPGSSQGHIVYYFRTGSLTALAFNSSRMEVKGSPIPVLDGVQGYSNSPFPLLGISDSGTLAYVAAGPGTGSAFTLVWVDRTGVEQPVPAPPRFYSFVRLSPEGQRIAVVITGQGLQLWVYDLARGTLRNLTSEGSGGAAIWTPDGKRLIYSPSNGTSLVSAPADASDPPSILASVENGRITTTSVSPDGKLVIGYNSNGGLWLMPLPEGSSGNAKLQSFLDSRSQKLYPEFSPDGHWVAYRSNETGRPEIYVAPYPGSGGKFLISTEGGTTPRWSNDGRELFYRNGDKMMAVDVQASPAFRAGTPKMLFQGNYANSYDVAPDGKRFLMIKPPAGGQASTGQVTVVLNWFEELRRRVPAGK
jgi:Tol biopolymer transport system component